MACQYLSTRCLDSTRPVRYPLLLTVLNMLGPWALLKGSTSHIPDDSGQLFVLHETGLRRLHISVLSWLGLLAKHHRAFERPVEKRESALKLVLVDLFFEHVLIDANVSTSRLLLTRAILILHDSRDDLGVLLVDPLLQVFVSLQLLRTGLSVLIMDEGPHDLLALLWDSVYKIGV